MAKSSTRIESPISNALEVLAQQFADSLAEGRALQVQLGDVARQAAALLKEEPDNLAPFVDACRQLCAAHELTEGSVDKTLSQLRGVIRALIAGTELPADASLRQMYEAIPKDAGKGGRKPRQTAAGAQDAAPKDAPKGSTVASAAAANPDKIDAETAIRRLFGHFDDKLADAVAYAVKNEAMFTRWAEASAKAAQEQPAKLRKAA